jgi:hypothetical protein
VAATASLRTIGLGAQQAAAGNHGHTSMAHVDSGTYTGNGGGPFVIVATLVYKPSVVHFQLSSSGGSINNGYAFMGSNAKVTLFAVGGGITDGNVGALGVGSVTIPASLNVNGIIYNWTSIG